MKDNGSEQDKIQEIQQELLEVAISGGMLGGYFEEGFPFYYINEKMLSYLGYESEAPFVEDIQGMITNCIHPDDQKRVDLECDRQLGEKGSYELDYRMKKKDGTYIWVHDLGKKFETREGRTAIMSLCYDITEEKEQQTFLKNLVDSMNGSVGNYLVDEDGVITTTYLSPTMGNMLGLTMEQYSERCRRDAMDCIYPADREKVRRSILETIHSNKPTSISFRAINSEGGYTWLNGSYSKSGEADGKAVIRVVFTPSTDQFELQQDIIHNVPGGVCLYKWDGNQVYPLVFSRQFATLYGGDESGETEEISGVNYEYVHPDDRKDYQAFVNRIVHAPGTEAFYTFRFWNLKEKRYVWINVNVNVIQQKDGSVLIYASYNNVDQIKSTEEQLLRNEEMLEQICQIAGVWTFIYDIETKVVYPGKTLQVAFGLKAQEDNFPECMLQTPYIPEESKQEYRKMAEKIDQGDATVKTDIQVVYPTGERHWLRYEWRIIEYQGERPTLAIGYAKSVDDERLLEARIKMEQERLLGGDGTLLAYVVSNIMKNKVVEHKTFLKEIPLVKVGSSMEEASVKSAESIVDAGRRAEFCENHTRSYLEASYASGVSSISMEYQRRKYNQQVIWEKNVMNILRDPETDDLFLYEYCYDINKEKLLEEIMLAAVNYDYERFGSVNLQENQISILVPDKETNNYQMEMKNYRELCFEYAKVHVVEEDRQMFLDNVLPENLSRYLERNGSHEFVHREYGPEREIHYKQDRHAYYDQERKICLLTRSDITEMVKDEERKQMKLQMALEKEQEAARVKSDFLSRMSHELRTPLNAIAGYTALVKESAKQWEPEPLEELEHLEAIQNASKYLLAIIGDLLDSQKIEAGKIELLPEQINVAEYMQNIVEMIRMEAERKRIRFSYQRLTRISETYYLDGIRLQQVLLNLLHNAIKFTPEGGEVRMTTESIRTENRVKLCFVVTDTGIGMTDEFMKHHLYQKFSQENHGMTSPYEGTGIGLAISKELVRLMGGEIQCESQKGCGTTFTVTILADSVEGKKEKSEPRKQHRRGRSQENFDLEGLHVLICEDNPMNQDMTRRLLKRMNCEVEVADDGAMGVKQFQESAKNHFQLILMDLRMPVMDGFEATRVIRSLPRADAKTLPILALSANAFEEDVRASLDSGMNEHLAKPVDARVLYEKIRQYCG